MEASSSSTPSLSWDQGKLFVGGISWDTGEQALRDHFKKYGEVAEVVAVKERATRTPRGFGFVLFSDPESAERALAEKEKHVILGRTVEVKRARTRSQHHQNQDQQENKDLSNSYANSNNGIVETHAGSRKIFVGGLSSNITEDEFKKYFEQFGRVTDTVVIYDGITRRSRGFGFVEFDLEESVEKVMKKSFHELKNKLVEVKIAVPKHGSNSRNADRNYNPRMSEEVGSVFGNYQMGMYPSYDPRYGIYYAPPAISGYNYGVTDYGGYGSPFAIPRSPWNGHGFMAARQNPVPFGNTAMYPGYPNGGVGGYMGVAGGGYYGMVSGNNKWDQTGSIMQEASIGDTITSQIERLGLDDRWPSDC